MNVLLESESNSETPESQSSLSNGGSPPDAKIGARDSGCWLKTLLGIVLLLTITYIAYKAYQPEVDPNLKAPEIHSNGAQRTPDDVSANSKSLLFDLTEDVIANADHPLEPLLKLARDGIKYIDQNVADYSAIVVKQARVNGKLGEEGYMLTKIRHERKEGESTIPFAVYTKFLKPKSLAGQEAIWVKGENDGKLVGHAGGLLNLKRFWLVPDGPIAMRGNLHPITRIGMKNLLVKMIETGEKDLAHDDCSVTISQNVKIGDHSCTLLIVKHEKQQPHFEYHLAKIYFDNERQLPIAYEGYLWPEKPGDEPLLLERYFYTEIEINPGLKVETFDPDNKEYQYPKW